MNFRDPASPVLRARKTWLRPSTTRTSMPQGMLVSSLWSILEIARTCRAAEVAGGGAAHPAAKMPNAAKPLR